MFYFLCDFVEETEIVDKCNYLFDACFRSIVLLGLLFLAAFFGIN